MAAHPSPHPDERVWARLRRGLADLGCSGAETAALAVLLTGGVAALALLWVLARPGTEPPSAAPAPPAGLVVADEEIVVHVAGQVAAPGLYRLPDGARVADALEQAGGPLPDAALDALNLARSLADGEQLLVPGPAPPGAGPASGQAAQAPSAWRSDGLLDLNRATPDDLEELPGIGPVLAERIATHRDDIGGFTAVGDLREVPGIGEKKFQMIAELVGV